MFKSKGQGDKRNGSVDERLFTVYTNADVEVQPKCDKSTELDQEEFLNTGGYVLKFTEETCRHLRAREGKVQVLRVLESIQNNLQAGK